MQKEKLIEAEQVALKLYETAETYGLIVPGKTEKQLNEELFQLAEEVFGIKKYWHKRIVRSGPNTLHPYRENPPDRVILENDILFFDFGPVLEDWEADLGRTYVIGHDPVKTKLCNDIEYAWYEAQKWFSRQKTVTGAQLFHHVEAQARQLGWEFGGEIAGHIIGRFPHEKLEPSNYSLYVHPENHVDMLHPDNNGNYREWILEIHFVDRTQEIGGFFEQLLT